MKKQYQIITGILVIAVFFSTNKVSNLKACGTKTTACATALKMDVRKKNIEKKETETEYAEDTESGIYMFMNPFIQ